MWELLVVWGVRLTALYMIVGVVFSGPFLMRGVHVIDPDAAEGSWGFRLLIWPGVVAFWPILALRWAYGVESPPEQDDPHRRGSREGVR